MPTWKELKRFLERDGWELYKQTDHYFYIKRDNDGSIRRTKVSMGSGEIKKHLWQEILKKQLQVTEEYFNSKI
ncbi:type II toxin-antitoxin system HicA family toxin [Thermoanaerobacterium thermosaccharolyticum]|jgi:predicted RNA binding protein YcfA (HicA-like mRNA interferase family)|uniref:YcfA family protein n=2 Tax=Thermoanaerobacterium thermosaccharolyticum TaxID=1517 RepID=D9TM67_THETC|nr:type II toxin-antitoxin system HicA family toxin [Thermoanaerobacterium thermosaccharolyticum]ADL70044.1 YcfA family protein [Thermoanaerobacterium thermosaccharolyticum DSM 571]AGB20198.1 YcfA-like protein [Thermoanaerobacterium thermosaccharolyticum M0795]KAA5805982.1 type II toxin-antitoxin system HicA family toxin [Thermoanaerobacterium thermosaccharolyticum]